jgi:hypothetical protein
MRTPSKEVCALCTHEHPRTIAHLCALCALCALALTALILLVFSRRPSIEKLALDFGASEMKRRLFQSLCAHMRLQRPSDFGASEMSVPFPEIGGEVCARARGADLHRANDCRMCTAPITARNRRSEK